MRVWACVCEHRVISVLAAQPDDGLPLLMLFVRLTGHSRSTHQQCCWDTVRSGATALTAVTILSGTWVKDHLSHSSSLLNLSWYLESLSGKRYPPHPTYTHTYTQTHTHYRQAEGTKVGFFLKTFQSFGLYCTVFICSSSAAAVLCCLSSCKSPACITVRLFVSVCVSLVPVYCQIFLF